MPQQTKSKKATNKKKKKLSKMPFVYIVILLIAVVITVCLVIRNNQSKNGEKTTNQGQQSQQNEQPSEEEPIILPQQSLIDMNNTENAKVEDGVKENTSSKLLATKTFKGLTFKDIRLVAEGGITRLTATVENTSSQDYEGGGITVVFKNKDGSEYSRLNGVLPPIRAGETNELDAGTTSDVANAYDFIIE